MSTFFRPRRNLLLPASITGDKGSRLGIVSHEKQVTAEIIRINSLVFTLQNRQMQLQLIHDNLRTCDSKRQSQRRQSYSASAKTLVPYGGSKNIANLINSETLRINSSLLLSE